MSYEVHCANCLEWLKGQPENSVDLIFGSPPYENRRTYGIGFNLTGDAYVKWMVDIWIEMQRVSKGLVAMVIEGKTQNFKYSATPFLILSELHKLKFKLRKPIVYHRVGISGSGGPDWLRNDWEPIICTAKGKLPWSNNVAMGSPCKYAPGGEMSHRIPKGLRVNERWEKYVTQGGDDGNGEKVRTAKRGYLPPKIANPGNVIKCIVGGGKMGNKLAHQNEAPFPVSLSDFFVKSFCPPDGIVLDPFCGSGTTGESAIRNGRKFIGIDIRQEQVDLSLKRLKEIS